MQDRDIPTIDEALKFSIGAIRRGDVHVGRRGLIWVIEKDPENITAWLWLASVIEDVKAKIDCYQRVLRLDPNNDAARKGLAKHKKHDTAPVMRAKASGEGGDDGIAITELDYIEGVDEDEDPVKAKLDISRRDLLDLSLFNKLINYRSLKTKGAEIIDEVPAEIYRILVSEGRSMTFLSVPEEEGDKEEAETLFVDESGDALGQPEEEEEGVPERHTDNKLQTPYTSPVLQKRLLNTYYAARTYIEEQGVNILFIALGMLHWYESKSSDVLRKAPLILVPIELSRTDIRAKFRIRYTDEEIEENLSLRSKLQSDFKIKLPDFPEGEDLDIDSYFSDISAVTEFDPRWMVDTKAVALGFFSFGKFLMFRDLASEQWSEEAKPENHPIIRGLLHDDLEYEDSLFEDDIKIDEIISPEETHHVVDADSSQSIAILEVNKGRDLVIQGPPGTGKSQTITNLIAEAVGKGKTILFVSEKMAALEVVKRRLDQVGLGDACLELHSHKTNKKLLLDELRHSLELGQPMLGASVDINELKRSQARLNGYSKAVNTEVGESRLTPFEIYGRLIQVKEILERKELPKINIPGIEKWPSDNVQRGISLLEEIQLLLQKMGRPLDHPFWGSQRSVLLPSDKELILDKLSETLDLHKSLRENSSKLSDFMMIPKAKKTESILTYLGIAKYIISAPDLRGVNVKSEYYSTHLDEVVKVLNAGSRIASLHDKFDSVLKDMAWNEDVIELRKVISRYGKKWWRSFSGKYREAKRELESLCREESPKAYKLQVEILDAIIDENALLPVVEGLSKEGQDLFGEKWDGLNSDWKSLAEITNWLITLYKRLEDNEFYLPILNFVAASADFSSLERLISYISSDLQNYRAVVGELLTLLEMDQSFKFGEQKTFLDISLAEQEKLILCWKREINRLQEVITFADRCSRLTQNGLHEVVEIAVSWAHADVHLVDIFMQSWLIALVQRAMKERPILATFDGEIHEHSTKRFCELDKKLLNQNQIRLAYEHWKSLPKHQAGGQLGVLYHEFAKKRRHKPIRKLIQEAGNVIQVIKPVFMMSPLSIAKFLPPETVEFDLVIFDEASQVKPVDAFGAILRGEQIVVVGDDRQLPPTTFFESVIDVDEDYSESVTVDLESILGLCVAQGIPQKMLRWHYRSQHESLITVSNYEFYDDKLVIFPSPDKDKREVGLVYHYLPDTQYDRGRSRKNIGEAKAVAKAVMEHAKSSPNHTLGVAAFSISQMQAVRDQVEILRRQDPSSEAFFRSHPEEPFFVKNLENVQGDERDVIFISVGYGRTAEGMISMNFGPINKEGGERRLNVLITRARKRCEVFTNLHAEDIDLNRTKARGVQVLKRFLKFAETGYLDIPMPSEREPDSPFEEAVASKLRKLGYQVEHQVGSGGFYIDLAIVDEDQPGRYLLGIECDGSTYHRAKSARDRDRLRQEVLENLGWRIHRIWSTDWFRNPEREIRKLEASIANAKQSMKVVRTADKREPVDQMDYSGRIKRHEPRPREKPAIDVETYKIANLQISMYKDKLHEVPRRRMAEWIYQVVELESPVHQKEVIRRIKDGAGVGRIGRRIKLNYDLGLQDALQGKLIAKRGSFLWQTTMKEPKLRSRASMPASSRKLEYVAPEEIELAIHKVVEASYGIVKESIPSEVCQLFGFKRTTEGMISIVNSVIEGMLKRHKLENQGDYLNIPD